MKSLRYSVIDTLRGITLLSMILYHAVWDLVYLFDVPWEWYRSPFAHLWQQSICCTFIALSGFCLPLGRHPFRRGMTIFLCGAVISAVTLLVMPQNRVLFGVLTLIGSCMLLIAPFQKHLKKCPSLFGCTISLFAFLLIRNADLQALESSFLSFRDGHIFINAFFTYLGFPSAEFYSTDYFPLLPWLFLFLCGFFFYHFACERNLLSCLEKSVYSPLEWVGRHTLVIYMIHQPVIYGVLSIFYLI